ncbi:right-handed parallel beta-helix repeat-containing protein [Paenibacillus silvisoli]|uniref:right-handed parallel beta-helix repeat-containing protein n=1 Tax=Paenibacillus silvisoli TaxID=3110539 RepID=UPI002804CA8E|nr:right-handed parallel beta-helix repeat-containing protein [Paenibacillus silvisoli]
MTDTNAIYVAPDGLDSNTGTVEQPVRTLNEAVARTRTLSGGQPKRIVVRGGHYYDVSIKLGADDEGLTIEAYSGEQPVLYGGVPVTAWQREGEWLTASLPGVRDRKLDFRSLEVNGQFRQRARLPETGAFRHFNEFKVEWLSTFAGGWARKPTTDEMMSLRASREDIGTWLDVSNAEVTVYHEWDESLVGVDAVKEAEPDATDIQFTYEPGHPPGAFCERNENARKYVVWNVKEGMKRPGQWYLDRTNEKLAYWPLPGERAEDIHVVAPVHEHLVVLDAGAKRIKLQGLLFACAATQLSAGGFGALHVSAAVHGEEVSEIEFERVTVRNTGGWAFKLSGTGIRMHDCHIHHTGAGGIQWKGERIQLERSRIHDIGTAYSSAIAINSDGSGHTISHNEIYNTPYSGIASSSPDTLINGNLLYDTMTFMKDGSAIYVCWYSDNVTVSGNAVFGRLGGGSGTDSAAGHEKVRRYAYYLDEKCTNCSVTGNLAVNLGIPMLSHMTKDCAFTNNIFLDHGEQTVSVLNSSGLKFERNILVADAIEIHSPQGNPNGLVSEEYDSHPYMSAYSKSDGITSLRGNLFCSRSGRQTFKHYFHYKPTEAFGLERFDGNCFGDPLLTDAAAGDFSYAVNSPALELGIEPLSFADVGCEGRYVELFERCMNGDGKTVSGEGVGEK